MDVNGISSQSTAYAAYQSTGKTTEQVNKEVAENKTVTEKEAGVVYESSKQDVTANIKVTSKEQRAALIQQMQADAEQRADQLRQLVQQMISKQGNAYGQANDVWRFLASGNFTVDANTKAQAQKDIAEDGYWGVKQTSERIFDFAKALAGDDVEKMKKMQNAFEKGFKQATKTWGKALPQISQDTYSAVNKKFEDFYASHQGKTEE